MSQMDSTASVAPGGPSRSRMWLDGAMLLFFLLLILSPMLGTGWDTERELWKIAAARELWLDGDREAALQKIREVDRVVLAESPVAQLNLARTLSELGLHQEALEISARLLAEDAFSESQPGRLASLLDIAADCLNHLQRESEALGVVKERYRRLPQYQTSSRSRMNHFAYQRALAGVELGPAEKGMRELMKQKLELGAGFPDSGYWELPFSIRSTLACVALHLELADVGEEPLREPLEALLEAQIEGRTESWARDERTLLTRVYRWLGEVEEGSGELDPEVDPLRRRLDSRRLELGMLHAARAVWHQRAGRTAEREADLQALDELGLDGNQLLERMPGRDSGLIQIEEAAAYADTLGYILLQRGELDAAVPWLDLAVVASETIARVEQSPIQNRNTETYADPRWVLRRQKASLAAIYDHRRKLRLARNETSAAESDAARIRSLGYQVGDVLF